MLSYVSRTYHTLAITGNVFIIQKLLYHYKHINIISIYKYMHLYTYLDITHKHTNKDTTIQTKLHPYKHISSNGQ